METLARAVSSCMIFCASEVGLGIWFAEELEHGGDVLDVLLAGLFGGVAGAEVVVALGQSETALVDGGDLLAGVFEVLLLAVIEESTRR